MFLHSPCSLVSFQYGLSQSALRNFNLSDFLNNFTNVDPWLGTIDQTSVLRKNKMKQNKTNKQKPKNPKPISGGSNESQPAPKSTHHAVVKKLNAVLRCVTCQWCSALPWENLGRRRVYKVGHSISRKICPTSGIFSGNHKSSQWGKTTSGKYWNHYLLQRKEGRAEYGSTVQIHEGLFGQRRRNQFLVFTVHKKKHNGFKLLWGRWLLGIRRDFPIVRTAKHWNELPATFPSLEALQKTV